MIQEDNHRGIERDDQSASASFFADCMKPATAPMVFQVAFYRDGEPVTEIYPATASRRDAEMRERYGIDSDNDPWARRSASNRTTATWGVVIGPDDALCAFLQSQPAPDLTRSEFAKLR